MVVWVWAKRGPFTRLMEVQASTAAMEISGELSLKQKLDLPDLLLCIFPKDSAPTAEMFAFPTLAAALFTAANKYNQPRCSLTNGWIRKIYRDTVKFYLTTKKN